jgi:hypothetical protein
MNTYTPGQVAALTSTFADQTGTPVDPTAVTFRYTVTAPDGEQGATTTVAWDGTTTTPNIGVIGRTAVGAYTMWVDTTGLYGTLRYEAVATGTGQSAGENSLLIGADPLS